jgi:3-hydroxyacyl-CoA dehydrogenase/enoyl-CoA hydratase/3-hydroxybutyryl-CoA epimerase
LDPKVLNNIYNWVLACRKTPVIVNDGPGFLVNRILAPYLNEGAYLVEEGYSIAEIDQVAEDFGMPMGPCRLMDEVGLDVAAKVGKILYNGLGERMTPSALSGQLTDKGLLGKKNKKGFYLYDEKGKKTEVNQESFKAYRKEGKSIDPRHCQMRLILPMINEAASTLEDKIVDGPKDVDLALIYGIGFPPFRGGLLKYADDLGLDKIKSEMNKLATDIDSSRFKLNNYLDLMIKEKKKFYSS